MAMNKKEQAEFDKLKFDLASARALSWTSKVLPDLPPPKGFGELTKGWMYRVHSASVVPACSSSIGHDIGRNGRTTSQQPIALYSTKLLALKALRYELEVIAAANLANLDFQIEIAARDEKQATPTIVSLPIEDLKKLVVILDDHGGALEGRCVLCDAAGWIGTLRHKPGCIASSVASENL